MLLPVIVVLQRLGLVHVRASHGVCRPTQDERAPL
jgi:hypothetical protein